ncbi:hypothetical protein, partial [Caldilinea sp.]|uniref:hypothetical protein n=1 Tax=Caldilinea sp. TaxID=2293560 RepID=UPI002BB8A6DF|nr:hypothetical protein [Caldilinea sp.]HRA67125.1 hypothetical protein [Caldilinea sp.]
LSYTTALSFPFFGEGIEQYHRLSDGFKRHWSAQLDGDGVYFVVGGTNQADVLLPSQDLLPSPLLAHDSRCAGEHAFGLRSSGVLLLDKPKSACYYGTGTTQRV